MRRPATTWSEHDSDTYRALSAFVVPERERQIAIIVELVSSSTAQGDVLDLCCGEGLLTRALLAATATGTVLAYDGSPGMIAATRRLCGADPRLVTAIVDIADRGWRRFGRPLRAAASSLAVHHLDDEAKRALFADLFAALAPGGVLALADVIRPATRVGHDIAARLWDEEVERRSLALAGDRSALAAFRAADWNHFRHREPDPVDKPAALVEHADWLRQVGFVAVDLHWMLAGQMIMSAWKR